MHRLREGKLLGSRTIASTLKTCFTVILVTGAVATAFGSGFPNWVGGSFLLAFLLLTLVGVFVLGVRSGPAIAIIGTALVGLEAYIWVSFRGAVPVGKELGAGLAIFALFTYGLGITLVGVVLDWIGRKLIGKSKQISPDR